MALSNAERQRLYIQRLKLKAAEAAEAANGRRGKVSEKPTLGPGARNRGHGAQSLPPAVTNGLSTQAKAMLKRLTRYRECSVAALIERWATAAEHRAVAKLKLKGKAAITNAGRY
jgi:hypothetical protein